MRNRWIVFFLLLLAVIIVAVIDGDYISNRPDRSKPNPFAYDVEEFKNIDPSLISYREEKNFKIGFDDPAAIAVHGNNIFVAGDMIMKVIDLKGILIEAITLPLEINALEVIGEKVFMAAGNRILKYDMTGKNFSEWDPLDDNSVITSITATENDVFFADAGMRRILRYTHDGEFVLEFDGRSGDEEQYGFIIPSPYFDLDINEDGELWIVNTGLHAMENFTYDGNFRSQWQNASMQTEGFSGCCNPAHFCFLPDGRYVTSEKGLVRIKTYRRSGEFEGVVAAPDKFEDEGYAPDVAADTRSNIYALDFDRKIIRVFTPLS